MVSRQRQWQIRNRDKLKAQQAVGRAVASGRLVRPSSCDQCCEVKPVQAHHHMGYDKERWLDVKWLCGDCHYEIHNGQRPQGKVPGNPHAKAMGKARWKGVPPEERSRLAKAAVDAREAKRAANAGEASALKRWPAKVEPEVTE